MANTYTASSAKERMISIELVDVTNQHMSLYISDIYDVLIGRIGLDVDDIEGVQQQGPSPKSFEVLIASARVWNSKNMDRYIGKKFDLGYGRIVTIDRPYEQLTHVIVKRIPMHWTRESLSKIFSWYGTVKRISRDSWRNRGTEDQHFNGRWNGSYKVAMKVTRAIPSSITVEGQRIEVHYRNQGLSCWRCGLAHAKRDCETNWRDYVNRFNSFNDFDLPEEEEEDEDVEVEEPEVPVPEVPVLVPQVPVVTETVSHGNVVESQSQTHTGNGTPVQEVQAEPNTVEVENQDIGIEEPEVQIETNTVEMDLEDALFMDAITEVVSSQDTTREEIIVSQVIEEPDRQDIIVQVHHAENSFLEETITASENEQISENTASDSDQMTPGQLTPIVESGAQASLPQEKSALGDELLIETGNSDRLRVSDGSQDFGSQPVRRGVLRRDQPSTDDETENTIGLTVGSFVNSMLSMSGNRKKIRK